MLRSNAWRVAILTFFILLLVLANGRTTPPAGAQSASVQMSNYAFVPATQSIPAGAVITWINQDNTSHTSTSDVNAGVSWNSPSLAPGQAFTQRFDSPGIYTYHCSIHPTMHGTIIVLAQSAPSPTGSPLVPPPPPPPPGQSPTALPTATDTPVPTPTPTTTNTLPPSTPHRLLVTVEGNARALRAATLRVIVRESRHHHPVSGVQVTLDGTAVGLKKRLSMKTSTGGTVLYRKITPLHAGLMRVTATKPGYKQGSASLRVTK
jgi:plastocyanin